MGPLCVGVSTPPFSFKKTFSVFYCWICKRRLAEGSRPGEGYGMQNAIAAGINGSFGFHLSSESITKTFPPIAPFPAIAFMSTKTILRSRCEDAMEAATRSGCQHSFAENAGAGVDRAERNLPLVRRRRCKGTGAHWEGVGCRTCVFFGRRKTMRAQMRSHLMCALRPASRAATSQQAARTKVVDAKFTTPQTHSMSHLNLGLVARQRRLSLPGNPRTSVCRLLSPMLCKP
ncbi:hypothetical protein QBC47DRAFT_116550 [Echria macrotheca]|uniref:Uncharacterized protein n=1 Tax=Echria macrotheca TaxID=438768 RepID=A0AAJ0BK89_9PEZI|nr:hypothetical protein QBC47DRAFT_116550 [Echria macrotheca]